METACHFSGHKHFDRKWFQIHLASEFEMQRMCFLIYNSSTQQKNE